MSERTRKRAFIPAFEGRLEPRIALATAFSAAVKHSFTPPIFFGGGQVNKSIPYLDPFNAPGEDPNATNPYQGISIAFNFTSTTFYKLMITGFPGVPGLQTAINNYTKTGNNAIFYQQLSLLAGHVPYGVRPDGLLYAWALGLYTNGRLPAGARLNGPAPTSPPPPAPILTNYQMGQIIKSTLLTYLQYNIGQSFNIVKSGTHPTDKLLTFNGTV